MLMEGPVSRSSCAISASQGVRECAEESPLSISAQPVGSIQSSYASFLHLFMEGLSPSLLHHTPLRHLSTMLERDVKL